MKKDIVSDILKVRKEDANKSTYGRLAIVGGSLSYPGSILISAKAALRTGVGYVALGIDQEIYNVVACKIPEVIYEVFKSFKDRESLDSLLKYNSIVFGNGFVNKYASFALDYLLRNYEGNLVIDASGLDALKEVGLNNLTRSKANIILTPHVGEFKRLFEVDVPSDLAKRQFLVEKIAKEYKCTIDLKDAKSIVTNGSETFILENGNAGLAKAGSGDMLAGLVGGFITHIKASSVEVTYFAHYMMNEASRLLAKDMSLHSFTASDVIDKIPQVLKRYEVK